MARKTTQSKSRYTDPHLRDQIKERLKKSSKGGASGQWSARKSQLLATEYKKSGGGYTTGKSSKQKSLDRWTDEDWQTQSGAKKARSKSGTRRYLPKQAWESLSEGEKKATEARKRAGSKSGKQYVANTETAKKARRKVSKKKAVTRKASAKKTPTSKKTTKKRTTKKTSTTAKKTTKKKSATAKKAPTKKKTAKKKSGSSKAKTFKRGDHVRWTKIGGSTTGKVIRKITRDTQVHGHQVRASKKAPQYEVATDATGKRAAHKPDKMTKL